MEMQFETTGRYNFTYVRMTIINNNKKIKTHYPPQKKTSTGQNIKKSEPLWTAGRNIK